eukprot:2024934-Rhodomonas_salina.5
MQELRRSARVIVLSPGSSIAHVSTVHRVGSVGSTGYHMRELVVSVLDLTLGIQYPTLHRLCYVSTGHFIGQCWTFPRSVPDIA